VDLSVHAGFGMVALCRATRFHAVAGAERIGVAVRADFDVLSDDLPKLGFLRFAITRVRTFAPVPWRRSKPITATLPIIDCEMPKTASVWPRAYFGQCHR
jgi:hypothetical protein